MARYYVTMTWDNWPEGGSYGSIFEAKDHVEAEKQCRLEMAETRSSDWPEYSSDEALDAYGEEWHLVDCFDLNEFIARHKEQ